MLQMSERRTRGRFRWIATVYTIYFTSEHGQHQCQHQTSIQSVQCVAWQQNREKNLNSLLHHSCHLGGVHWFDAKCAYIIMSNLQNGKILQNRFTYWLKTGRVAKSCRWIEFSTVTCTLKIIAVTCPKTLAFYTRNLHFYGIFSNKQIHKISSVIKSVVEKTEWIPITEKKKKKRANTSGQ